MNVTARLATLDDLERLVDYIHTQDGDVVEFLRERLLFYIKANFVVLAEDKNKNIVGRLLFSTKEEPKLGVGELEGITVHKDYRHQGIGALLLQKAIESAGEYFANYGIKLRCLYLMTRLNNTAAQGLYEKFGFKKISLIGKIYRDDQPEELVMSRFF